MEKQQFEQELKNLTSRSLIAHFANWFESDLLIGTRTEKPAYFEAGINDLTDTTVTRVNEDNGILTVEFTGHNKSLGKTVLTYAQPGVTAMGIVTDRLFNL